MEPASSKSFAFDLLSRLSEPNPNSNIVISPLSISLVLTLTLNGAVGATQKSILSAINQSFPVEDLNKSVQTFLKRIDSGDKNVFKIANAVYTKTDARPEFIDFAKKVFLSKIDTIKTEKEINDWVSEQTNKKIPSIVDSVQDIVMLLINTVFFLGQWKYSFDEKSTVKDVFYCANSKKSNVEFMHKKHKAPDVLYYEDDEVQLVELPYKESDFSGIIVLPKKLTLASFCKSMTESKIKEMLLQASKNQNVDLYLPKFILEYSSSLKPVLGQMGMEICFGPSADFSNMGSGLFIGDVVHKTFIQVDEKGTSAAAATAVSMLRCMPVIFEMKVNKPFLFIIQKKDVDEFCFISKIMEL